MPRRMLVVVLSNNGQELDRATAANGQLALKQALLMLAKRDKLTVGDVLRVKDDAGGTPGVGLSIT
jgi:hypothetical protein